MIAARCCRLETFPVATNIQTLYAWGCRLAIDSMSSSLINLSIYKWMTAYVFVAVKLFYFVNWLLEVRIVFSGCTFVF